LHQPAKGELFCITEFGTGKTCPLFQLKIALAHEQSSRHCEGKAATQKGTKSYSNIQYILLQVNLANGNFM